MSDEAAQLCRLRVLMLGPPSRCSWSRSALRIEVAMRVSGMFYVWACLPLEDRDELRAAGFRHF